MAMLSYNEVKERKYIILEGQPYEVLSSHVFRKQMRKPVNQTKLRNLLNGSVTNQTFHGADTIEEAEIDKRKIKFMYKKENRQTEVMEYWFCEINNPAQRFFLEETLIGDAARFMKANSEMDALLFDEKVFGVKVPIKVDLKVTDAPPATRGNTAGAITKIITLETGATVNAPIFITEGEVVRINTETGEYVERVQQ